MRRFFIAALCLLSVLSHVGQGVVLCFGADGHVAVESAGDGKCCQETASTTPELSFVADGATTGGCGVCSDVRVGDASVQKVAPTRVRDAAVQIAVDFVSPKIGIESINTSLRIPCTRRSLSISTTPLSHLRTVTLLT